MGTTELGYFHNSMLISYTTLEKDHLTVPSLNIFIHKMENLKYMLSGFLRRP